MKISPVRAELFRADRQTDRHDEANSGVWQILPKRLKSTTLIRQSVRYIVEYFIFMTSESS